MTPEQKAQIVEILAVRAEIAGKTLSQAALIMMVEDMADMPFESVRATLAGWGRTNRGFPEPADVRAKVMPEIDDADDAQDVANLVISAISSCGYTNPGRAREKIGELGWTVVERMGGWKHLCETTTHDSENFLRAQIRDYTKTVAKRAKRGELDETPALPSPVSEVTTIVHGTIKRIGDAS